MQMLELHLLWTLAYLQELTLIEPLLLLMRGPRCNESYYKYTTGLEAPLLPMTCWRRFFAEQERSGSVLDGSCAQDQPVDRDGQLRAIW